ncbi:MAG: hypothetical protein K0S55_1797 [Clostridia bacterium]|nr:hypothetical protein [Clostridia bacterium]
MNDKKSNNKSPLGHMMANIKKAVTGSNTDDLINNNNTVNTREMGSNAVGKSSDKLERLVKACENLKIQRTDLNKKIYENIKQVEALKKECSKTFADTNKLYEEYNLFNTMFSGDGGISYYISYYLDFCRDKLDKMDNKDSIQLLVYNNILYTLSGKCTELQKRLENTKCYDEKSFYESYNIILPSEKIPAIFSPSYKNEEDLVRYYNQLKKDISDLENIISEYKETERRLQGITDELNNRIVFIKNNNKNNYASIFSKLKTVDFNDYIIKENETVDEYKTRLIVFAEELLNIRNMQ